MLYQKKSNNNNNNNNNNSNNNNNNDNNNNKSILVSIIVQDSMRPLKIGWCPLSKNQLQQLTTMLTEYNNQ